MLARVARARSNCFGFDQAASERVAQPPGY